MIEQYDSASEHRHATDYDAIGFKRRTQFDRDYDFTDPAGETYTAKPDRYNDVTGLYVDEKYAPLNHKRNRATAKRAEAAAAARYDAGYSKAKSRTYYQLQHGWNHSVPKHVGVQLLLSPEAYVPSFEKPIQATDLEFYYDKGLRVCTRKSLPSYNAWAALSKAGVPCEFRLHSDDGSSISYEQFEQEQADEAAYKKVVAAEKRRMKRQQSI